jgi:hypothetical protein
VTVISSCWWYPLTSLHGITTQRTKIDMFSQTGLNIISRPTKMKLQKQYRIICYLRYGVLLFTFICPPKMKFFSWHKKYSFI